MAASLKDLMNAPLRPGRLAWIGLRPARRAPLVAVAEAEVRVGSGLAGDHHDGPADGKRVVSMIQAEHLPAVAAILGRAEVSPFDTRRNLVIAGVNLLALKGRTFAIGDVVFACTGPCAPCGRMDENLGPGGFQAMRGHGGIITRVLKGGTIRVGDPVLVHDLPQQQDWLALTHPGEE